MQTVDSTPVWSVVLLLSVKVEVVDRTTPVSEADESEAEVLSCASFNGCVAVEMRRRQ